MIPTSKIVVPPAEDIVAMDTPTMLSLRVGLIDAVHTVEGQIATAKEAGTATGDWIIRSNGALGHFRRGLAIIKAELTRRGELDQIGQDSNHLQSGLEAINVVGEALREYKRLYEAVQAFIDDDNDDNYARLCVLVDRNDD